MHQFQDRDYINLLYFVYILLPSQTMSGKFLLVRWVLWTGESMIIKQNKRVPLRAVGPFISKKAGHPTQSRIMNPQLRPFRNWQRKKENVLQFNFKLDSR